MDTKTVFDLCIIGGGPAGVAAGVYAARKKISTIFITEHFRNQSVVSEDIQNWIGTISISGENLASNLEKHLKNYSDAVGTDTKSEDGFISSFFKKFLEMKSYLTRRIAKDEVGSPRPLGRGMKAESFAHITFALHSNYIRRDRGIIRQR